MAKLDKLEEDEGMRETAGLYDQDMSSEDDETREVIFIFCLLLGFLVFTFQTRELAATIREKKKLMKIDARIKKQSTKPKMPRTGRTLERSLGRLKVCTLK
jgi:nucleolar GTP-binding protein